VVDGGDGELPTGQSLGVHRGTPRFMTSIYYGTSY
jgi:hypothetical protein